MAQNEIIPSLIKIDAIKLSPSKPFTWASGWLSPIYCDNRLILSYPVVRTLVTKCFQNIINEHFIGVNVIAGVATGAIAHGALVAQAMDLPFVYVRSSPKGHGLANLIEGEVTPGQRVVVVEDLISTGKSSLMAVESLRDAGVDVIGMVAIFTYGFRIAQRSFDKYGVNLYTLTNYNELIDYAVSNNLIDASYLEVLKSWREEPQDWGR